MGVSNARRAAQALNNHLFAAAKFVILLSVLSTVVVPTLATDSNNHVVKSSIKLPHK